MEPFYSERERRAFEAELFKRPSDLKYQKAYLCVVRHKPKGEIFYLPVDIKDGRISFGKVQFEIAPHHASASLSGRKWVERKMLVLEHDSIFGALEASVLESLGKCPQPKGLTSPEERRDLEAVYEKLYSENPNLSKHQKAFLLLYGNKKGQEQLHFQVQILAGRVSFGRPQYLVVPYGAQSEETRMGHLWVSRKALLMEHNRLFPFLEKELSGE